MKGLALFVVTADQIRSRRGADLVPAGLRLLEALSPPPLRGFERTAGDEIQGVADTARTVVQVADRLLRDGRWRIGIGVGPVEQPLPVTTRAGRGAAFRAARAAVEAAHPAPGQLAVRLGTQPGAGGEEHRLRERHTGYAESALLLYAHLLRARSRQGWEVVDLLSAGLTQAEAAARLGVSPSAVSQRVRRTGWHEQQQGVGLLEHHLSAADGRPEPDEESR